MRAVQSQRLLIVPILIAAFSPSARGELVFEVLHRLDGGPGNASSPRSALIEATDGSFYGTTAGGGEFGHGTVFVFDPPGDFRILHSLREVEGREPQAALIEASDGSFYGTATFGGEFGAGTVFKIDRSGSFTTIQTFNWAPPSGDGALPQAPLIEASDGNFYGTTVIDGRVAGGGTVFRITSSGAYTVLHSFSLAGPDGANSTAALVEASEGTFYGTTSQFGASGLGTVFRIDGRGRFSTLISFDGSNGAVPQAGLVMSADGNIYGTTAYGGEANHGTIFRLTPTGTLTTIHSFKGDDGSRPIASLIEASDGNFYGTTALGGPTDNGTVFTITPAGAFTTLHSFDRVDGQFPHADGQYPHAGLLEASDGSFYGTTVTGGSPTGAGIVFRLKPRETGLSFLRGDCNNDGVVEGQVADAVFLLNHNFLGGAGPDCLAACDVNGDGGVLGTVTDGVHLLMFNFLGGPRPVDPFPQCGASDVESDAALGCQESSCP